MINRWLHVSCNIFGVDKTGKNQKKITWPKLSLHFLARLLHCGESIYGGGMVGTLIRYFYVWIRLCHICLLVLVAIVLRYRPHIWFQQGRGPVHFAQALAWSRTWQDEGGDSRRRVQHMVSSVQYTSGVFRRLMFLILICAYCVIVLRVLCST